MAYGSEQQKECKNLRVDKGIDGIRGSSGAVKSTMWYGVMITAYRIVVLGITESLGITSSRDFFSRRS